MSLIQSKGFSGPSGSLPNPTQAGSQIFGVVLDYSSDSDTPTMSDTVNAGNYAQDSNGTLPVANFSSFLFRQPNPVGGGSPVITCSQTHSWIFLFEYGGLLASPLDKVATPAYYDATTPAPASGASGTTSQAAELIVAAMICANSDTTAATVVSPFQLLIDTYSGLAMDTTNTPKKVAVALRTVGAAGSYQATFGIPYNDEVSILLATYKLGGGASVAWLV